MRTRLLGVLFIFFLAAGYGQQVSLVTYVRAAVQAGAFPAAQSALNQYRSKAGVTPEFLEAFSWVGRGQLARHNLTAGEQNAAEVHKLCLDVLQHRKLDVEPQLPLALGASIEVQAQSLAQQNRRDEAVVLLRSELKKWQGTSIAARVQKNLNLLTLEGKPAPMLDVSHGIGSRTPLPLSAHRGHPVLLFMWAHWCSDCKAEIAVVQKLIAQYGPKGLIVVAPTQRYGYVAGGKDAPPDLENRYIAEVFAKYYAGLGRVEIPLSEANFTKFGVSTTPTMVLIDRRGIVRMYNPGNATYQDLAAAIEPLLQRTS